MSGKVSGLVWELDIPHGHAWILMSLADHAEHDGTKVFPGHSMTAWKTGYSVRQVKRICSELWHNYGLIEPVTKGGGANPTEWRICLENFKQWKKEAPPKRGAKGGNKNAAKDTDKQTSDSKAPVTSQEQTGDTHAGARRNVSIETSNDYEAKASRLKPKEPTVIPLDKYTTDRMYDAYKEAGFPRWTKEEYGFHVSRVQQILKEDSPTEEEMHRLPDFFIEYYTDWNPKADAVSTLREMRRKAAREERDKHRASNVTPLRAVEPTRPKKRVIS